MAKVGKKNAPYDPFKDGRGAKAYQALTSALDDLDAPKEELAAVPEREESAPKGEDSASKTKRSRKPKAPGARKVTPPVVRPVAEGDKRFAKRFQATRGEGAEFDAAAVRFGAAVGSKVDFSKITRSLWQIYLQHEDDILRNVSEAGALGHPATGDGAGLAELEEDVVKMINRGLMLASRRRANLE